MLRPALCCPPRAPDRPPKRSTVSAPRAAHPRVPPQRPSVTACPVTCVNCQRQSCSNESPAVRERCCLPRAPRTPFLPASAAPRQCSGLRSDGRRNRRRHGRRGGWQCANRRSTSDAHKRRRHCGRKEVHRRDRELLVRLRSCWPRSEKHLAHSLERPLVALCRCWAVNRAHSAAAHICSALAHRSLA